MLSIYSDLNKLSPPAMLTAGTITLATVAGLGIEEFCNLASVNRTLNWSQCPGKIVSSSEHGISYEYRANEKEHSSSKIYFDQSEQIKAKIGNEYRVGQAITVYYDPKNASNSVLKTVPARGKPRIPAYFLGGLLGLAMIFNGFRRRAELRNGMRKEKQLTG